MNFGFLSTYTQHFSAGHMSYSDCVHHHPNFMCCSTNGLDSTKTIGNKNIV